MSRSISTRPTRRVSAVAVIMLGLLMALLGPLLSPSRASAAPTCATAWGSLAKTASNSTTKPLVGVRTGSHACYDRLVLDLGRGGSGSVGYDVRYVTAVYSEGRGEPLPVRGTADLKVTVKAPAYDSAGRATYRPTNPSELSDVSGYSAFRQVRWGGSFEGQSTIALGVRARLPMRTFVINDTDGSRRLVIDVAHTW